MLDEAHGIHMYEPWSRPGDYVMLQVLSDLVCVSTACPDDIDAADGWNPTDVQVRVYGEYNFIGREALERRKASPVRGLVGLAIEGGEVPEHGDCIRLGRAQVGGITSAVKSPILGRVIALARVDVTHAAEDTELEIKQLDGHQKRLPARVVSFPHFDPTKERAKGNYTST